MSIASEFTASAGYTNNGDSEGFELARAYRAARHRIGAKGLQGGATRCLAIARADIARGAKFYPLPSAKLGAPSDRGGQWAERPEDIGLRFVGFSDEIGGRSFRAVDHRGWYLGPDDSYDVVRGCVYQLPARNGQAVYVEAFRTGSSNRDGEWRDLGTQGGACVFLRERHTGEQGGADCDTEPAMLEAARGANEEARIYGEKEREYQAVYQAGREAAEADAEAIAARAELVPLLREMRAIRKSPYTPLSPVGAVCARLRRTVAELLETISTKRAERDSSWGDVQNSDLEAWLSGFMDESGFVRAAQLGYAKASDWRGAPEANPCNRETQA